MSAIAEPVTLSQGARTTGRGVLDVASPLPDGWQLGIEFAAVGCVEPEIVSPCVVLDTGLDVPTVARFDPVLIRQNAACSVLSGFNSEPRSADRLTSTTEWALGQALALGIGTDLSGAPNPTLNDATSVHTSVVAIPWDAVIDAVSCLEQAVADTGFGARAFLHAPPRAAAYLERANQIDANGRSPAGHRWIISAGYPAAADSVTLWATGTVWAAVDAPETLGEPSFRQNTDQTFRQRYGLAAFDPCLNLSATFPVPACTP